MDKHYKKEGKYSYYEAGEGTPIVILHGLMGGLSNFDAVAEYFPTKGYKVVIPDLPIYTQSILKTNVKSFAKYVKDFITFKGFDQVILLGNSLGGHIALYHTKLYPEKVAGLVITGSSGLYESAMGDSYPKRGDYEYNKKITFSIDKIKGSEIIGHSIVSGNIQKFKGKITETPIAFEINAEEPGNEKSDGEFVLSIKKNDTLLSGKWNAFKKTENKILKN